MPTTNIAPYEKQRFFDAAGLPLAGGKLFTYAAGTTTKQNSYTDSTGATPNTNPIILDAAGYCNLWLDQSLAYKVTLSPSTDTDPPTNPIWTVDQLNTSASPVLAALAASPGSSLVSFLQAGMGAVPITMQAKGREFVVATEFAANGVSGAAVDPTGVLDSSAGIQAAIDSVAASKGTVAISSGTYNLGTTGLLLKGVTLLGGGRTAVMFNYAGTTVALDAYTTIATGGNLEHLSVTCSNSAATAIKLGNRVQHNHITDVAAYGTGTGNTGSGLLMDASTTDAADIFSGNFYSHLFYASGFKYGVHVTGPAPLGTISNRCWTTFSFNQTYLLGPAKDAGSIGFYMDKAGSGTGSTFFGGTTEGFDVGLQSANGALGLEYMADIENCNTTYSLAAGFSGIVKLSPAANRLEVSANGTANNWMQQRDLNGDRITETYYSQKHVIKITPGGAGEFSTYVGESLIDGGAPTFVDGVFTNGTLAAPEGTYRQWGANKISWSVAAPPTGGTWTVGDIVYCSGRDLTTPGRRPNFWRCSVAGTPGTWVPDTTYASYTLANAATTVISLVGATAASSVQLTPTNAAAATLMGSSKSLYVSSRGADTLTLATADGTSAAGTETFQVRIFN